MKIAADDILIFYFYLLNKIRLDFSRESLPSRGFTEISSLIFSEKNEKIFMNVLCYRRDWRFILSGEATLPLSFLPHFPRGSTFKGKNLLLWEQILVFKSRPHSERASLTRDANRKLQKLFPFVKMAAKHGSIPMQLKICGMTSRRGNYYYICRI